jgi:iron complex transport system ATP-binding protein
MALKGMGINFNQGPTRILNDLCFEWDFGQVVGVVGPNGCGKTTLLQVISGVLPLGHHDSGSHVLFSGQDKRTFTPRGWAQRVTYVGSDISVAFPVRAEEFVSLGGLSRGPDGPSIPEAMELCRCGDLQGRWIQTLSGGERQRVALARAVHQGSKVLLIDEGLSKVDPDYVESLVEMLKARTRGGALVVLVAHDLGLIERAADTVALMTRGQLVASGSAAEILRRESLGRVFPLFQKKMFAPKT